MSNYASTKPALCNGSNSTDNLSSDTAEVNSGVPQGSIFGPTLFIVYINGIICSLSVKQTQFFTFADDTVVVFYGNSWSSAERLCQQGLQEVFAWLRTSLLKINSTKTKIISSLILIYVLLS